MLLERSEDDETARKEKRTWFNVVLHHQKASPQPHPLVPPTQLVVATMKVEVEFHGLSLMEQAEYQMAGAIEQAEAAVMKPVAEVAEGVSHAAHEVASFITMSPRQHANRAPPLLSLPTNHNPNPDPTPSAHAPFGQRRLCV